MTTTGYLLIITGTALLVFSGVFFYTFVQNLLAAGTTSSSSSVTISQAVGVYNGTAYSPLFVGLSFFGMAFLVMGAVFVVGGHITEQLGPAEVSPLPPPPESVAPKAMPARACTKCGSLLYQNTAYCPNCGSPLGAGTK